MQSNGMVALNATTYDELEFTNLGMQQVPVCLTAYVAIQAWVDRDRHNAERM